MNDLKLIINKLDFIDNNLLIEGSLPLVENIFYFLDDQNNKYDLLNDNNTFKCIIPLNNIKYLLPNIELDFRTSVRINNDFASLYLINNDKIIKYNKKQKRIDIYKNTFFNRCKFELKCVYFLLKKREYKSLLIRELVNFLNFFKSREIWLITDRKKFANDNGEMFFKYVITDKLNTETKYFFALDRKSCDYKRLHFNYSNVIDINSLRYKWLFLISNYIICSSVDEININPFGQKRKYLSDLFNQKFIFLQGRGNNKKYFSNYRFDLITSNNLNDESLSDNVVVTGFARNDYSLSDVKRKILIIPDLDDSNYEIYYRFFKDEEILSFIRNNNYEIKVISKKVFEDCRRDLINFDNNVVYNEELEKSSLLITNNLDFLLDFSYLKRPVIYIGDNNVLGVKCLKYSSLIKSLKKFLSNDCEISKRDERKIEKCFKYLDFDNCERIYEQILKLR